MVSDTTTSPSVLSFAEPEGLKARGTLIVIPGRGEQPAVYTRFGQRLANDAYRVLVVGDPTSDHTPGEHTPSDHTPSDHTPSEHTPAEHTPELLTVQFEELTLQLEQLAAEARAPVVLVGSDTGALFAAAIAAEDRLPAVAGLILAGLPSVETAASTETDSAAPADRWESELDARTTCPTHRGRISDQLVTPGALYGQVPAELFERAALASIEQPILGLHGQDDPISPLDRARELLSAAPSAELVSIVGGRHDVLNDQTHRTVAATTVLWLERLRADTGLAPIAHPEPAGASVA